MRTKVTLNGKDLRIKFNSSNNPYIKPIGFETVEYVGKNETDNRYDIDIIKISVNVIVDTFKLRHLPATIYYTIEFQDNYYTRVIGISSDLDNSSLLGGYKLHEVLSDIINIEDLIEIIYLRPRLLLNLVAIDTNGLPVYTTLDGELLKDISPNDDDNYYSCRLYTVIGNKIDGNPDRAIYFINRFKEFDDCDVVFMKNCKYVI